MFKRSVVCSALIILFYLVGLIGFLIPTLTPLFLKLVPFHLLLMLVLLLISQTNKSTNFWLGFASVYLLGFIVEVLGVNSGLIFGTYTYGTTLGLKLYNTPLLIGINWIILVYSTGIFLSYFRFKSNLIRSFLGALILVLLDLLIEPVAIKFDYWSWKEVNVPIQNYLAWFIISFLMFMLFFKIQFEKKNQSATVLFFVQIAFFIALNLWAL